MLTAAPFKKQFRQPSGYSGQLAGCLMDLENRQRSDWTVDQLEVQPYQQILEIGYGTGRTLQEVARRLKIGLLAGIDHSTVMYHQAFRRNRKLIQDQLLQLHIGGIPDLSYPGYYFHSIYGSNVHFFWKEPQYEFMQLAKLLKCGGKLLMVFQPRGAGKDSEIEESADLVKWQYQEAGLQHVRIEYKDMHPVTCISAIGYKP
jgi:SAM-dependent methyltransferase